MFINTGWSTFSEQIDCSINAHVMFSTKICTNKKSSSIESMCTMYTWKINKWSSKTKMNFLILPMIWSGWLSKNSLQTLIKRSICSSPGVSPCLIERRTLYQLDNNQPISLPSTSNFFIKNIFRFEFRIPSIKSICISQINNQTKCFLERHTCEWISLVNEERSMDTWSVWTALINMPHVHLEPTWILSLYRSSNGVLKAINLSNKNNLMIIFVRTKERGR